MVIKCIKVFKTFETLPTQFTFYKENYLLKLIKKKYLKFFIIKHFFVTYFAKNTNLCLQNDKKYLIIHESCVFIEFINFNGLNRLKNLNGYYQGFIIRKQNFSIPNGIFK